MIIACWISGCIGCFIGVMFMALFIAGANEDRYMEMEARKKCRTDLQQGGSDITRT